MCQGLLLGVIGNREKQNKVPWLVGWTKDTQTNKEIAKIYCDKLRREAEYEWLEGKWLKF